MMSRWGTFKTLIGALDEYKISEKLKILINLLWSKKWVVYAKEPFANAECVVKYLGRYKNRIAISNQRIVEENEENVKFRWKDYTDNNHQKTMTVTAVEFLRRFFLHILPDHYTRIRYFGFLSNSNKSKKLKECFNLLQKKYEKKEQAATKVTELFIEILGIDITCCKKCKIGHYELTHSFNRSRYGPLYQA